MIRYSNHSGNSGVTGYASSADSITVRFSNGETYLYTYNSTGRHDVEQMKRLAKEGRGLSTYISTKVKSRFARKL